MTCLNYKYLFTDNDKARVFVQIFADNVPNSLDTSTWDYSTIKGFPQSYLNTVVASGSTLYIVSNGAIYIANDSGTFVLQ